MRAKVLKMSLLAGVAIPLALMGSTPVYGLVNGKVAKVDVLIGFTQAPGQSDLALVKSYGGEVKRSYGIVNAIAASVPQAAIAGLEHNPNITVVENDGTVTAADLELDNSWGVDRIDADLVHPTNTGAGINIAIIDSGIDIDHYDLAGNYRGGYDFVNNDSIPEDELGHGTHVSGTIAALDNGVGVVGVAPQANIYALKILDENGSGTFGDVIAALDWCVAHNIQVTNNSYGALDNPGEVVEAAFANAYAHGIVNVASSGNNGSGDTVGYPARYSSVIAVGATDQNNEWADFSSTGATVELVAPGYRINSTTMDGQYGLMSGTSMAAPHVAGSVALVMAQGTTNPDAVRELLQTTAKDLGTSGRDSYYGYGLVDVARAVAAVIPPENTAPELNIQTPAGTMVFEAGSVINFSGMASDQEDGDLSANIVWSSSRDGALGTGGTITVADLSEGTHNILAQVSDSEGLKANDEVVVTVTQPHFNTVPVATIINPSNGTTFDIGTTIKFSGMASDQEDGDLSANIVWSSSRDGALGTGGTITVADLSEGTHTVFAQVSDSEGLVALDQIVVNITIPVVNQAPEVNIVAPVGGTSFQEGDPISFSATANDNEDGDLSANILWSSSLDGTLGSGETITAASLSEGTHTIRARITDSGGIAVIDTVVITVVAAPSVADNFLEIAAIDYATSGGRYGDAHLSVTIHVSDSHDNPVVGATIKANLYGDGKLIKSYLGTTSTAGTFSFKLNKTKSGVAYSTVIASLEADGLEWSGDTPINSFSK